MPACPYCSPVAGVEALPEPNLLADAGQILGVPADLVRSCLTELAAAEGVVREPVTNPRSADPTSPAVYLVAFHRAEIALATALGRLSRSAAERLPGFAGGDWARALAWLRGRSGVELAVQQEQAVRLALTAKVAVLTGAGRGLRHPGWRDDRADRPGHDDGQRHGPSRRRGLGRGRSGASP